jgi:hypothetical protein
MKQQGFAPILILVLIAVLAIGGYLIYKQQFIPVCSKTQVLVKGQCMGTGVDYQKAQIQINEISSWGTYTNNKVGFQIKYPHSGQDVPIFSKGPDGGQTINADGTEDNLVLEFPGNDSNYRNSFGLDLIPFSGTLEEVNKIKKNYNYSNENVATKMDKTFSVSGEPTSWYQHFSPGGVTTYEVVLVAKQHAFIFHASPNTDEKLMEQILSTFKFIAQASVSPTPDPAAQRDMIRKLDVKYLFDALEVNKDYNSNTYIGLAARQFASGKIPTDPVPGNIYCAISPASTSTLAAWAKNCPAGWSPVHEGSLGGVKSWTVCAWLEKTNTQYCQSSVN